MEKMTISGALVRLNRFKEWWQVQVKNGQCEYTVFQSTSRTEDKSFMEQSYQFPANSADLGSWLTNQRRGRVVRQISVYP